MSAGSPSGRMTREELIDLVGRIMRLEAKGSAMDAWVWQLVQNVPHPHVSDMIFWPDKERTPEEIVDEALAWKPPESGKKRHDSEST
jgi:hypothetical protein